MAEIAATSSQHDVPCPSAPGRAAQVVLWLPGLLVAVSAIAATAHGLYGAAARVLGSNPATLAARWNRLRERGLAWVTAHPGGSYRHVTLALVEVDCLPGARRSVVEAVCRDPRAVTVEESTRGRDLLLTVITPDLAA